ncbi:50S ribosomal protein L19 [Candidatus Saccharibacteria bacterium]|nr:50S ribosomal protein L19 [Candidatus Saccharibacteria bacterium]MCB9821606.1 50S ribosomal protein L19 [Candidatus Nomurabacteria bacterium]
MSELVKQIGAKHAKKSVVLVRSGDVVRVHQKIKEGNKERVQVFEGLVIRVDRKNSPTYRITVRKIASGVGVEKGFMMHSPSIVKVEVVKRSKVRRNYLTYIRELTGKSARLSSVDFDQIAVNTVEEDVVVAEEQAEDSASDDVDTTDTADSQAA